MSPAPPATPASPSAAGGPATPPVPPPPPLDPFAMLLSLLIPGLGQVYQGRVGKGVMFFLGLYALFFYGQWLGQWKNVWLPDVRSLPPTEILGKELTGVPKALAYRPQYAAQFWVGVAAWPAAYQYANFDPMKAAGPLFGVYQRAPSEDELNAIQRDGDKRWDLGWVYTVIAGVLNLLVIYDAFAGPMFRDPPPGHRKDGDDPSPTPAAPEAAK